jgi:S-adenosylmethionine hydrolase
MMSNSSVITLLSDFGLDDVYVGILKGAIARVNPQLAIIDLTHQIPPQNRLAARFCLLNAYAYFPAGTVHVAVVDPGVGSARRGVAIAFAGGYLVGPDNGIFSGILARSPAVAAVELSNPDYWHTPNPSTTFHGRDIFAPVGAHLASGVPLEQLGRNLDPASLVSLSLPTPQRRDREFCGRIQYIDYFGNLITTIPGAWVLHKLWSVKIGDRLIPSGNTYSDVAKGELVAIVGSHGWVEVAANCASARSLLQIEELAAAIVQF